MTNHVDRRLTLFDVPAVTPPTFVCQGCGLRIERGRKHEQNWWWQIMDHWNRVHPERRMKV